MPERVLGARRGQRPDALVGVFSVCVRIRTPSDERFERVGQGQDGQLGTEQCRVHGVTHGRVRGRAAKRERREGEQKRESDGSTHD
jgi:hypothetical protein